LANPASAAISRIVAAANPPRAMMRQVASMI
jgi:hypothetical protein